MIKPRLRPIVEFDPADRTHRQIYAEFLKNNGWHKSPVMFYVDAAYGNVLDMIRDRLSAYYLEREFKFTRPRYYDGILIAENVVKIPQKTAEKTSKKSQKIPKKVSKNHSNFG
jgi:hypothetical protein